MQASLHLHLIVCKIWTYVNFLCSLLHVSQVITDNRQLQRVSPSILLETDSDKNDTCIGAAILQLTDCPTPATPLDPIRESEVTLPLQPKGSIQLAMSFSRGFDR